ncbi:right-handed parallel beta-helix repeat-containing protein [Bacillus sp. YIM B13410]|uniref:right-handed parallel beta-helix repeat-containing protein n=1 Tax=Bacillus sp. YIM B13410 TaxID=3366877 RepID=UPI003B7CA4F5
MKRMISGALLILLMTAISFGCQAMTEEAGAKQGTAYYVAANGNDKYPGTKQKPFRTLKKAASIAKAGTTVYMRGGTYKEKLIVRHSGTKKAPVVFQAYGKEKPVISGASLKGNQADGGLVKIDQKSYITLKGLTVGHIKTNKEDVTPIGMFITGSGKGVKLLNNRVYDIQTTHQNGNAHGIAVYGTKAPAAIEDIEIKGNTVEKLKLGFSEALVLNGNVKKFRVTHNTVRHTDNIGIDLIGFENVAPSKKYDQVRNGVVSRNKVYEITSVGNPAYGKDISAGGIYVDGGKDIVIDHNISHHNDLGIEVTSEHKGKMAERIRIERNQVYLNRYTGISIGGYDKKRGGTTNTTISHNILYKNDTAGLEGGQLLMQYQSVNNRITNNIMTASASHYLVVNLYEVNKKNTFQKNVYDDRKGAKASQWVWRGKWLEGYKTYRSKSGQDKGSAHLNPQFVNEKKYDFRLKASSPAKKIIGS